MSVPMDFPGLVETWFPQRPLRPGDIIIVVGQDNQYFRLEAQKPITLRMVVWAGSGNYYLDPNVVSGYDELVGVEPGGEVTFAVNELKPCTDMVYLVRWGVATPGKYRLSLAGGTVFGLCGVHREPSTNVPTVGVIDWTELSWENPPWRYAYMLLPCSTPQYVYVNDTGSTQTVRMRFIVYKAYTALYKSYDRPVEEALPQAIIDARRAARETGGSVYLAWEGARFDTG